MARSGGVTTTTGTKDTKGGGEFDAVSRRVSLRWVRGIAALTFVVLGVLTLLNVGNLF